MNILVELIQVFRKYMIFSNFSVPFFNRESLDWSDNSFLKEVLKN